MPTKTRRDTQATTPKVNVNTRRAQISLRCQEPIVLDIIDKSASLQQHLLLLTQGIANAYIVRGTIGSKNCEKNQYTIRNSPTWAAYLAS